MTRPRALGAIRSAGAAAERSSSKRLDRPADSKTRRGEAGQNA